MGSETRFLKPLAAALARWRPPAGPFRPEGAWEHAYAVLRLTPERGEKGEHPQPYGTLLLKRRPAEGGRFQLEVDLDIRTRARAGMRTRASIACAAGRLATLQAWELRSDTVEAGRAVAALTVSKTATVPRPFTSNWSLMEAVQRLPFDAPALEFDMFEDLDLYKPRQTLHPVAAVEVECAGKRVRLHGFRQTGRGILPTHYWLDDEHRLIAAAGSLRAFLWEGGSS
jgi:hypothetical protein